jgi:hypothetical protein
LRRIYNAPKTKSEKKKRRKRQKSKSRRMLGRRKINRRKTVAQLSQLPRKPQAPLPLLRHQQLKMPPSHRHPPEILKLRPRPLRNRPQNRWKSSSSRRQTSNKRKARSKRSSPPSKKKL